MRISLLAVLALCALSADAAACSCVRPTIERRVWPADGATAVPTNALIQVHVTGGLPHGIRVRLKEAYRLVGPAGPIPLEGSLTRTRLDLRPTSTLQPATRYRLEQLFAYDTDGKRVDDHARLRLAVTGGWVATRRWYPVSVFTTGPASAARPLTPRIDEAYTRFARGGGDCGPGVMLGVRFAGQATAITAELEIDGQGVVATAPVRAGENRLHASNLLCTPDKVRIGKGPFTVRLAFIGADGARVVSAPTHVAGGGLLSRAGRAPAADKPEWAGLWFKGAIQPSVRAAAKGPRGCEAGLEALAPWTWAADGAVSTYDARNALAWLSERPRALIVREKTVGFRGPGKHFVAIHSPATSVRSAPRRDGAVIAILDHQDDDVPLTVMRLDARGAPKWTRPVVRDALNWKPRIAACGARVLVAWERVVGDNFSGSRIHWALLNDSDGAVIARAKDGFAFEGQGLALGCGGDGAIWLVGAFGHSGALRMVRFADDAPSLPADLPRNVRSTTSALAPHPAGALLLTDHGAIEMTALSADGAAVAGPFLVGRGRKPAVVRSGSRYVAAWERYPGDEIFATALDATGRIAEPTRVAQDHSTVTLLERDGAVLLGASNRGAVKGRRLRCRAQPSERAPARLP